MDASALCVAGMGASSELDSGRAEVTPAELAPSSSARRTASFAAESAGGGSASPLYAHQSKAQNSSELLFASLT